MNLHFDPYECDFNQSLGRCGEDCPILWDGNCPCQSDIITEEDFMEVLGSECDRIGIMGGCGEECPVLLRGECPSQEELIADGVFTIEEFIEMGVIDVPITRIDLLEI